jgi:retinol dehydrogenase 14
VTTSVTGSLSGRTAVITGATSGIGLEIARGLALRGARTVIVGRGTERAAHVAQALADSTANPEVEPIGVTDLALLSDVRELAATVLARYPRVHILVNNAGAFFRRRDVTPEGHERTFALNVLAPFLLTSLLADRLRESAPSRVVNVSSAAHRGYHVDFADLEGEHRYAGFRAYGRSKLELLLLTREFARRFAGTGVSVNAVHPGFVASRFGQNNQGWTGTAMKFLEALFAINPRRGAETPIFVATDPSAMPISGEYFVRSRVARGSAASYDLESARRLYDACRVVTGAPELPEPSGSGPAGYRTSESGQPEGSPSGPSVRPRAS